jgi:hypothetical protein
MLTEEPYGVSDFEYPSFLRSPDMISESFMLEEHP